jgi:predicted enzyme related to lactoylglutathione lyase
MAEHGTFIWNELETTDQKIAGDFYCRLLGWTRHQVDAGPFGGYTLFRHNDKDVAGMMNPITDYSRSRGPTWNAYLAVDDVDECASRVTEAGGKLIVPPHDVPDVGRVCMIADPTGATILLMTPVAVTTRG